MTKFRSAVLALATLTLASTSVHASPVVRQVRAQLTEFNMDPRGSRPQPVDGFVAVDFTNGTVTLSLDITTCNRTTPCPPSRTISSVTLPLVSSRLDGCGSHVYIARKDARPVDGVLREITVTDHTGRICEDLRRHLTDVTETITLPGMGGNTGTVENTYGGGRLTPSRIHH